MRDKEKVDPINEDIADNPLAWYDEIKKSVSVNTLFYGKDAEEEAIEITKLYPNSFSVATSYVLVCHILLNNQYQKLIDFKEIEKYYEENEKYILYRFPMLNDYEKEERVETFFFESIAQLTENSAHGNETEIQNDELYNFINKKYNIITEKIKNEKI